MKLRIHLANFLFAWMAFFFLSTTCNAQSISVSPLRLPRGGNNCAAMSIRLGDVVSILGRYYVGPGGPVPNELNIRVFSNGQQLGEFLVYGGETRQFSVSPNSTRVDVCVSADPDGYDSNDIATATASVLPRPNLEALGASVSSDGSIRYGYRVGGVPWDPRGNVVEVELFYFDQPHNRYFGSQRIGSHTMRTAANSSETFTVAPGQVPSVPDGATHLLVWIDRQNVVFEETKADNFLIVPIPKPNLVISQLAYDDQNNIKLTYRYDSVLPIIPPSVPIRLEYAKGPQGNEAIDISPRLMERELFVQDLPRNRDNFITLIVGNYPLPTFDATHLLASIDSPDNRLIESSEADNKKTATARIAPGYSRLDYGKGDGVAIYRNGYGYYVTVIDLTRANLASSLNRESTAKIGFHYKKGFRRKRSRGPLRVVVNAGHFRDNTHQETTDFTYGIKHDRHFVDLGYETTVADGNADVRFFSFNSNSAGVLDMSSKQAAFSNPSYKNIFGVISPPRQPTGVSTERTIGALRDPYTNAGTYGETRYRTLLLFSTDRSITFERVAAELRPFGSREIVQFDSSWSTNLVASRTSRDSRGIVLARARRKLSQLPPPIGIGSPYRNIPHALLVFSNRNQNGSQQASSLSSGPDELGDTDDGPNVLAVKKSGTQTGRTEFSLISNGSGFSEILDEEPTGIHLTDTNYKYLLGDWDGDGVLDLYVIKKLGVSSTEVHILSGASGYKKFLFQIGTPLPKTNAYWEFALTDWDRDSRPDLVAMSRAGGASGRAEGHILSGASNYQQYVLHAATPLPYLDTSFDLQVGDWDGDTISDLIAVKRNGVTSTEVHIVSGVTGWTQYGLQSPTALHRTDMTWSFAMTDWDRGGKVDLVCFKKQSGASGSTEIHVLRGESQFQDFIVQTGTALPPAGSEVELLISDSSGVLGEYDPTVKRFARTETGIFRLKEGSVFEFTGEAPGGWRKIDNNPSTSDLIATASDSYQFHENSGYVYWWNSSIRNWQEISNNVNNRNIAATDDALYSRSSSGSFYQYTGIPYSWTLISQDPLSVSMAATRENLYQMHSTGRILKWSGSAWTTISTSYSTRQIATDSDDVFARRQDGEILSFDGEEWLRISNPDSTVIGIESDGETLYRKHSNGRIFRFTGTPIHGWQMVSW